MQKDHKLFDDLARLATGATGSLLEIKREIESMVSSQLEKLLSKMQLVTREELEIAKEMAENARQEQEALKRRVEELEKLLSVDKARVRPKTPSKSN